MEECLTPSNTDRPPQPSDDLKSPRTSNGERIGWTRLVDLYRTIDQKRIKDVNEDLDALLVFAGLFSAVVATFVIQSYTSLQLQPQDITNQILIRLSQQMASFSTSASNINSTLPALTLDSIPFSPSTSSIRINTLWSWSLVISLITASLGILVKQWLHEFMTVNTLDPKQQVKIRIFRDQGLRHWRVFELAAFLPFFLKLALLLFLTGLSDYLRNLNPIVGWATSGLMLGWLAVFIFMLIAPIFSAQCPYKTPILMRVLNIIRTSAFLPLDRTLITKNFPQIQEWVLRMKNQEEDIVSEDLASDTAIILHTQHELRDDHVADTLEHCSQGCDALLTSKYISNWSRGVHAVDSSWLPSLNRLEGDAQLLHSAYYNILIRLEPEAFAHLQHQSRYSNNFDSILRGLTFLLLTKEYRSAHGLTPLFMRFISMGYRMALLAVLSLYSASRASLVREHWAIPFVSSVPHHSHRALVTNVIEAMRVVRSALWGHLSPGIPVHQLVREACSHRQEQHDSGDPDTDAGLGLWTTMDCDLVTSSLTDHTRNPRDDYEELQLDFTPDPIIIVHVFSQLCLLLPPPAIEEYKTPLLDVVHKLVDILCSCDSRAKEIGVIRLRHDIFIYNSYVVLRRCGLLTELLSRMLRQLYQHSPHAYVDFDKIDARYPMHPSS